MAQKNKKKKGIPVKPAADMYNQYKTHTYKSGNKKVVVPCHTGPQYAFEIGKSRIFGSRAADVTHLDDWDLMVPLCGDYDHYTPANPVRCNQEAQDVLPSQLTKVYTPAILAIDWPDFDVPYLDPSWWKTLVEFLFDFEGDVVFFCQGGHGRTGTALTILATLSGNVDPSGIECPIYWLRERYCDHAVETYSQLDYIEKVTGMQAWSELYYEPYGGAAAAKSFTTYPAKASKGAQKK